MSEAKLEEMHADIRQLRAEVGVLRKLVESLVEARDEGPDQMVDAAYVARLFGCAVSSARAGKAGTAGVRWTARRPLRCTRREAHRALRAYVEQKERRRSRAARR